jgi:hypothetical protein
MKRQPASLMKAAFAGCFFMLFFLSAKAGKSVI